MKEELIKKMEIEFCHKDERGELLQLISQGYNQINVLKSNKGAERGEHYHKENKEAFYVVEGSVIVKAEKGAKVEKRVFETGDFFIVPPMVKHSFLYPENNVCIQLYDKGVILEGGRKDIYNE